MPAARKAAAPKLTPEQELLAEIATIVRHPEANEHGGRNRYKRDAIVAIRDLTKDIDLPDNPESEPESDETPIEDAEETEVEPTEVEPDPPEAA